MTGQKNAAGQSGILIKAYSNFILSPLFMYSR